MTAPRRQLDGVPRPAALDWPPGHRPALARAADPLSSHRAADALERSGRASRQLLAVLEAVATWPGRSSRELAELAGLDRHDVARRLPILARRGLVRREVPPNGGDLQWWPPGLAPGQPAAAAPASEPRAAARAPGREPARRAARPSVRRAPPPGPCISAAQRARLWARAMQAAADAGWSRDAAHAKVREQLRAFGYERSAEIRVADYDRLCGELEVLF